MSVLKLNTADSRPQWLTFNFNRCSLIQLSNTELLDYCGRGTGVAIHIRPLINLTNACSNTIRNHQLPYWGSVEPTFIGVVYTFCIWYKHELKYVLGIKWTTNPKLLLLFLFSLTEMQSIICDRINTQLSHFLPNSFVRFANYASSSCIIRNSETTAILFKNDCLEMNLPTFHSCVYLCHFNFSFYF